MEIYVRIKQGIIEPVHGARRLDAMLSHAGEATVTIAGTLATLTVVRNEYGDIVEKDKRVFSE